MSKLFPTALFLFLLLPSAQARPQVEPREMAPALEFPAPGLDDTTVYRDYQTRFFRDAGGNTVQVVLNQSAGRAVNLWADAANESISFSVRDSAGKPVRLAWGSQGATVTAIGPRRFLSYVLTASSRNVDIGHLILGSMRVERDFQYAGRQSGPLTEVYSEEALTKAVENLAQLSPADLQRSLVLLRAGSLAELRARLQPGMNLSIDGGRWVLFATQPTFDGKNLLTLDLSDDTAASKVSIAGNVISIRAVNPGPVKFSVRIGSDSPSLTPLNRDQIFSRGFMQFYARIRTASDSAAARERSGKASPVQRRARLRFELLERQVRSIELLSFNEKLMAGLPNFATYFGRDMMMSAMMMEPVWQPAVLEHVISSVLGKLSAEGKASHEEALGGEAIREHAALYNRALEESFRAREGGDSVSARTLLLKAETLLGRLQETREDYMMVDETFQLPVLAGRYLSRNDVSPEQKREFLLGRLGGTARLALLLKNFSYVWASAAPFSASPDVLNLVGFPRLDEHRWRSGSWRDSGAGYANGRFAMDVNAIWVPAALAGMQSVFRLLPSLHISSADLDSLAPALRGSTLGPLVRKPSMLDTPLERWRKAYEFFTVRFETPAIKEKVQNRLSALPEAERAYWNGIAASLDLGGGVTFLALSLDSLGKPIPVMNTDPATWLFLGDTGGKPARDKTMQRRVLDISRTFVLPYPAGLFVSGLGPLVANDVYASSDVWENFERDRYHSPRVVWGREVNLFLLGESRLIGELSDKRAKSKDPRMAAFLRALQEDLAKVRAAVDASGLKHNELWSYAIAGQTLAPARYGSSCDLQLWNLTDLAVEYALDRLGK